MNLNLDINLSSKLSKLESTVNYSRWKVTISLANHRLGLEYVRLANKTN